MPLKTLGPIGPRAVGERLKNRNVFGGYAKSILPYMENTPIHNSKSISANFRPNPEKILILYHLTGHDRMGIKTSHTTVPLKRYFYNIEL
jgi:hypothetical protein